MTDQSRSKSGGHHPGAQQIRSPSGGPSRPGAKRVRIQIGRHCARTNLPPELVTIISPLLQSSHSRISARVAPVVIANMPGSNATSCLTKKVSFAFPAGLVARLVSFLHQHGYQVTVTDFGPTGPQYEDADVSRLAAAWAGERRHGPPDGDTAEPAWSASPATAGRPRHATSAFWGISFPRRTSPWLSRPTMSRRKGLFFRLTQRTNRPLAPLPGKQQATGAACS